MFSPSRSAGTQRRADRIFRIVGYGAILLLACFISMLATKIVLTSCLLGALAFFTLRKRRATAACTIPSSAHSRWLVHTVSIVTLVCFLTILCAATSEAALGGIIWSLPFLLPLLRIVNLLRRSDQLKKGLARAAGMGFLVFIVCKTLFSIARAWESPWWEQTGLFMAAVAGVIMTCASGWAYYALPRESHDIRRLLAAFGYPFVLLFLFVLWLSPENSPEAIHVQMARRRLGEINKATSEYAKRFGVFPRDLVALDSPPRNQKADCRAADLLSKPFTTEGSGYIFQYRTGLPSSVVLAGCEGVSQYTLTARPVAFEQTGDINFYTDESGIIRCTFADRPASADDDSFCDFSRHVPN
jgi:hypothetical protein